MTEDELERILSEKMKACVAERHLPGDFTARLVASARRSRTAFRLRLIAAAVLLAMVGVVVVGFMEPPACKPPVEASLIAARGTETGEEVSGLVFLGFIRECIRRARTNRRKEED